MFTGIIEEKAVIEKMEQTNNAMVLTIQANTIMKDIHLGDSISVNGVCLTVTSIDGHCFTVDVMPETMKDTSLRMLKQGAAVNVERAMPADGRFGGHFVSGHVDATGTIRTITPVENAYYITIELPKNIMPYMMVKGSVTVDGISLTVFGADAENNLLTISIIPHTWQETVLSDKHAGDPVNIETDMLMKYTEHLLRADKKNESSITTSTLKENGFI
ncbi:riboflavin synthase alpha chain [Alteribacillus persepolensis]|uniref:Riboflavin synthase n=1 Tax=Alteribacillus persepolensis TaxID=568899 RepID=A0A1G7ZMT9_9BACI|nr:riboflavin synthase [Alteribacillus persepolensis]SDH10072.1 riboflavin synthase alpha chain [Alteribacillus persepolensis]